MSLISADLKGQLCNVILTMFKIFKYQNALQIPDNNVFINGDFYCDGGMSPEKFGKTNVGNGFIFKRIDFFKKIKPYLKHEYDYQNILLNGNFQTDIKSLEEAKKAMALKKDILLDWMMLYPNGKNEMLLFKKKLFNETFYKNGMTRIIKIGSNPKKCVGMHIRRNDFSLYKNGKYLLSKEQINKNIASISKNKDIMIFSDDIVWCKDNLKRVGGKLFFSENASDTEDLMTLAACSEIVKNRGSSFSSVSLVMNICSKI